MGIFITIIIAAFCVYLFGLNMGNKGGRRERERELESVMAGKKSELDKGQVTHIVQCKYWSQTKTIHEKHIAQLFGTTVAYKYEHPALLAPIQSDFFKDLPRSSIIPIFITSTNVSEQARKFAKALGVTIVDNKKTGDFPRIKCNNTKDGEKIFHLPFDQQLQKGQHLSRAILFIRRTSKSPTRRCARSRRRGFVWITRSEFAHAPCAHILV